MPVNTTRAIDYGSATISTTALALASITGIVQASVDIASRIRVTVNSNAVRYRYDGGTPTTSDGHFASTTVNNNFVIEGNANIQDFRIIRDGALDATVSITVEQ